jgi:bifunctional non-homologous end joining protein LigD
MLCTLVAEPFDNSAWIFEPKYDGLRVLARFDGRDLTLLSRNHASQNFQFPDVVATLQDSLTRPVIVDGEVVCLDKHGRSSFRALQQRFHLKNAREVEARIQQYPAYLYLFDLLYVDAYDVTILPLKDRKALLREVVHWSHRVRWTEYQLATSEWTQNGLLRQPRFEGLRMDKEPRACHRERPKTDAQAVSLHHNGSATGGEAGMHVLDQQSMPSEPGDTNMALKEYRDKRDFSRTTEPLPTPAPQEKRYRHRPIFVVQEHHASHLHYDFRLEAEGALKSWAVPKEPSMDPAQKRLAVQVEDHPLAYAKFQGTIPEGQYGAGTVTIWDQGLYDNLLADKPVSQTVTEGITAGHLEFVLHGKKLRGRFALIRMRGKGQGKEHWLLIKMQDEFARPEKYAAVNSRQRGRVSSGQARSRTPAQARTRTPTRTRQTAKPPEDSVVYTHTEKLMYPETGITKGAVLDFYQRIASRLLPYLYDRPATLERLPEGLNGPDMPHFWQKRTPDYYPEWIERVELPSERGQEVQYVLVNNEETLLYLVNQGTLTFHVGFSRVTDLDQPDFVLFDLDPGQAGFAAVVTVTKALHQILQAESYKAFVKTSGKTGLHVLVSWERQTDYDAARAWALGIAQRVVEALPDQATTERSKAKRGKRVYVDIMQNAQGHHAVPPYVLRAVPGAPVSTPLRWQELTPDLDPQAYNLQTIFQRLARQQRDPMAGLFRAVVRPR